MLSALLGLMYGDHLLFPSSCTPLGVHLPHLTEALHWVLCLLGSFDRDGCLVNLLGVPRKG